MNNGSSLFEELSREQLEHCCRRYLGEPLTEARLLSGGLFNTTYRLQTASKTAILRLGPVNRHLLQPYEHRLMEAEALVLRMLERRNIPSSRLLALDLSRSLADRDVMVVEAFPAVAASTKEWTREWENALCRSAGAVTRRIHEITAEDILPGERRPYGRLGNVLAGFGGASWAEAIAIEVRQWCDLARAHALAEDLFIARVESVFLRHEALFNSLAEARLTHADLWFGNVLADENGELVAVIDIDRTVLGDPEWEFATGWMTGKAFCEGYGREPDPAPESVLRRRLYKLLMDLEDVFVLQCQYNKPSMARQIMEGVEKEISALEQL